MWERECEWYGEPHYFGRYNEDTGFFELNGVLDISYQEALRIWARSEHGKMGFSSMSLNEYGLSSGGGYTETRGYVNCRTYFPIKCSSGYTAGNLYRAFSHNATVEAIAFVAGYGVCHSNFGTMKETFNGCTKLRRVIGSLGFPTIDSRTFAECESLEEIELLRYVAMGDVNLSWSPRLSDASVAYLINNAKRQTEGDTATYIFHPQVYARIPAQLFETALSKGITIATTE